MIRIGSIIDERYDILKEIDRGGMSIVYLAQDNRLKKLVAIKDIRKNNKIEKDILLKCLKAEADLLTSLDHQNLPKIYDIIEGDDHIYVVMDYIEGESLKKKLDNDGVCSYKDVIEWGKQLSDVLNYIHTRKPHPIIYRDMKPHNIMLTPEGKIKLIDFGISIKSDEETESLNFATNNYAAPEQLNREKTDNRTDIYSLGVTLYHLVTGLTKKNDPSLPPIRTINPSLPEGLEYIINKCIKENPQERYDNCNDIYNDLCRIDKLTKNYKKKIIKHMSVFILSFILFCLSCGVTVFSYSKMKWDNIGKYKTVLNEASTQLIDENYSEALELLDKAITEIDGSRSEAYIKMLDIYISLDDVKGGIDKVESYINDKYGDVDKNDEVLFKLGMTYLDNKNYPLANKYFKKVSKRKFPEVKYYTTIANTMSSMNIDYKDFLNELKQFEDYVDTLPNDENKLNNYNSLANIYSSYKTQLEESNDKVIEIINKADTVLDAIEDQQIKAKYEVEFCQKLAQAYHSKGSTSKDDVDSKRNFSRAITLYNDLLSLEVKNSEDVLIKLGDIYNEQKEYSKAIDYYKKAINNKSDSIKAYCKLINVFLDVEQEKDGSKNYSNAKEYYNIASKINGADSNAELKKVRRRMENLEIL